MRVKVRIFLRQFKAHSIRPGISQTKACQPPKFSPYLVILPKPRRLVGHDDGIGSLRLWTYSTTHQVCTVDAYGISLPAWSCQNFLIALHTMFRVLSSSRRILTIHYAPSGRINFPRLDQATYCNFA